MRKEESELKMRYFLLIKYGGGRIRVRVYQKVVLMWVSIIGLINEILGHF